MSKTNKRINSAGPAWPLVLPLVLLPVFVGISARGILSPLQEVIKIDLGASDTDIALLQGVAIALPVAILSLPIGRFIDRTNRSRLLTVMTILAACGCLATAFATSIAGMFVARMLVSFAATSIAMTSLSIVSDVTEPQRRGRVVMAIGLTQILGGAVSFVVAGPLLDVLPVLVEQMGIGDPQFAGWRLVQIAVALFAVVVSLVTLMLVEPARIEVGGAALSNIFSSLSELWKLRRLLIPLAIGTTTINMADAAADIWAVPVLTRNFKLQPSDFGAWMGALLLLTGALGGLLGGVFGDFCQRYFGRSGIVNAAVLGGALSIIGALYPLASGVLSFACLLGLLQLAGACSGIASAASLALLVPNELRGVCISIMAAVSVSMSYGVSPLLVTILAKLSGLGEDIAYPLALVGVVTSLLGVGAFAMAAVESRSVTLD